MEDALDFLCRNGAVVETDNNDRWCPRVGNVGADNGRKEKVRPYLYESTNNFLGIRDMILNNGPVVSGMKIYGTFSAWGYGPNRSENTDLLKISEPIDIDYIYGHSKILQHPGNGIFDEQTGIHAVCIVGWQDLPEEKPWVPYEQSNEICMMTGYWIVKNSWGTDWGDRGYCYIPYGHTIDKHGNKRPYGECGVGVEFPAFSLHLATPVHRLPANFFQAVKIHDILWRTP